MKHLIFDTETTGLPRNTIVQLDKQPRVIEFAGILWDDATGDEQEHVWLFNPGIPIPPDAIKISHITDVMVHDAPAFADKAPAIRITFGLRNAPDSWRDYVYWNVKLDDEA